MESADADLPSLIWSNYIGGFHKNVQSLRVCDWDCEDAPYNCSSFWKVSDAWALQNTLLVVNVSVHLMKATNIS